jgi:hypothetical protein
VQNYQKIETLSYNLSQEILHYAESEKLLGEVGNSNSDEDAHHPRQFINLGIKYCDVSLFCGKYRIQSLG